MAKAVSVPTLKCSCGAVTEIPNLRIGDSVDCATCKKPQVVLRSKVQGDVPPADGAPGQISDRLPEVRESLERIRMRRAGHAARGVALYPLWAIFALQVFGFYLVAYLVGQNLSALGYRTPGRRLQIAGMVLYSLIVGAYLVVLGKLPGVAWADNMGARAVYLVPVLLVVLVPLLIGGPEGARSRFEIAGSAVAGIVAAVFVFLPESLHGAVIARVVPGLVPILGSIPFILAGSRETQAAFEAGAKPVFPVLPAILGLLLGIAQFFAFVFVQLSWNR